ncbi:Peptidase S8 subtilisin-related protein [Dioscorea alata]|uniref:Peptidase S8 subtilisin-related protein n=1 Tax=Dioscorea alata TaxID=55571 RepID=A0ACB7WR95_DIOAL|nr:Peptidase S8 subtilisin-related protein [Dioscorea alata]
MIIGLIDTGAVLDHPSFSGEGMPKPPLKWKGRCDFNVSMCNNKLMGLRVFLNGPGNLPLVENEPLMDDVGHGTHTSSSAASASVAGADVLGNGKSVASGITPKAHVAMYKAHDSTGCYNSDILVAIDAAIVDGVDVLSLLIGTGSSTFYEDMIGIEAFSAIEKGIFLTVTVSTTDRSIRAMVKLGNGLSYEAESLNQSQSSTLASYPLVFVGDNNINPYVAFCVDGAFDGFDGLNVLSAGGAGMIIMNQQTDGYTIFADPHVLPGSEVSYVDGLKIMAYIDSTANVTTSFLFQGTLFGQSPSPAPAIASFSSCGPDKASPGILKPVIVGPGVNVLAALHSTVSIIANSLSPQFIFNIISGTSMATPHLAGIATLIKAAHPDWSPAAIKSAIMTTADIMNKNGSLIVDEHLHLPADLFAVGAGHMNPVNAVDPGLRTGPGEPGSGRDSLGYNSSKVGMILRRPIDCKTVKVIAEAELNHPSLSISFADNKTSSITVERTVKNVGETKSNYSAKIDVHAGVNVTVQPNVLQFTMANQELKFNVTVNRSSGAGGDNHTQKSFELDFR